jgi:hypothetical protein
MQRNSDRGILENRTPGKEVSGNENFKGKNQEEREEKARKEVISGGAFR